MINTACIILAAGKGTRMQSNLPKVLHKIAGRSLLGHVLTAANEIGAQKHCIIAGPDMANVEAEAKFYAPTSKIAVQTERNGTGHAVKMAGDAMAGFDGTILILYGDVPLITAKTLKDLASQISDETPLAVLGFHAADPKGYGRLITNENQNLVAIREELDASELERNIDLCNSGIMAVQARKLWPLLERLTNDNANQEYYLTDIVGLMVDDGSKVAIGVCDETEVAGVNDRKQLSAMEETFQNKLRDDAMKNGATLVAPHTVFFSADTKLGKDVIIEPNVIFGPGVWVGDGTTIFGFSHLLETKIGQRTQIGPYARLRPGTDVKDGAKVGNFVEIKKSTIGKGAKVNHLTYIGDSDVGEKANIGAGTITCNYDGFDKYQTKIGKGAFIGSNSSLIAPVKIGDGAYVGSATVVTNNVEENALAVARAKQENKQDWATRFRAAKLKKAKKG